MNRQARRAYERQQEKKRQIQAAFLKSGITQEDLKRSYKRGFDEGFRAAGMEITKCCYAAIALVVHEEYGFDGEKTIETMRAVQDKVLYTFHHSELAEELLRKSGIVVDWGDEFQEIREAEDSGEQEGVRSSEF